MRIADMQRREPFDAILDRTLAAAWTELLGRPVEVQRPPARGAQAWRVLPLFSALVTGAPGRAVRRFLKDQLRFTRVRWRLGPQWALAEALAAPPVLRRLGRPALSLSPAVPGAEARLILPGNQRVRLFDFAAASVRVRVKDGFERRTMATEIGLRTRDTGLARPPWLPITAHDAAAAWFDEPIVAAWELGRLPPWVHAGAAEAEALRQLDAWLDHTARDEPAAAVAAAARAEARAALALLRARFPECAAAAPRLDAWIDALAAAVEAAGTVVTAHAHGDLQPGNVLVGRTEPRVWLIDWEHAARRGRHYDRLVYGLGSRAPAGLAPRLRRFLAGRDESPALAALPGDAHRRRRLASLFVLEDLTFYLRESTTGPYTRPSAGLDQLVAELGTFGEALAGLVG